MGDVNYVRQMPEFAADGKSIVLTAAAFESIGDYTRSSPTGPTPGRIYKKNFGWPDDMDDNWCVYICEQDPKDDRFVLHHPHIPLIVE